MTSQLCWCCVVSRGALWVVRGDRVARHHHHHHHHNHNHNHCQSCTLANTILPSTIHTYTYTFIHIHIHNPYTQPLPVMHTNKHYTTLNYTHTYTYTFIHIHTQYIHTRIYRIISELNTPAAPFHITYIYCHVSFCIQLIFMMLMANVLMKND